MVIKSFVCANRSPASKTMQAAKIIRESVVPNLAIRSWRLADKACRIVNAPCAFICGDLRICADRTRAIYHSIGAMGSHELSRRLSLLKPLRDGSHGVPGIGTVSTAAMSHAGKHEQADGILRGRAHRFKNTLIVIDGVERRYVRIGPSVIH